MKKKTTGKNKVERLVTPTIHHTYNAHYGFETEAYYAQLNAENRKWDETLKTFWEAVREWSYWAVIVLLVLAGFFGILLGTAKVVAQYQKVTELEARMNARDAADQFLASDHDRILLLQAQVKNLQDPSSPVILSNEFFHLLNVTNCHTNFLFMESRDGGHIQ